MLPTLEAPTTNGHSPADAVDGEDVFNRPPRILRFLPRQEVEIPAPPQPPSIVTASVVMVLLPLMMGTMYVVSFVAGGQGGNIWRMLPMMSTMFLTAGIGIYTYRRQRQLRIDTQREQERTYQNALTLIHDQLLSLEQQQREIRLENDPDPVRVAKIIRGTADAHGIVRPEPRLWERRTTDADFLQLRIGNGALPTTTMIKPPPLNLLQYTPHLQQARALARDFATVKDVPLTVPLCERGAFGVAGASGLVVEVVRAMLLQAVAHHAPGELRIAAFWDSRFNTSWDWLHWLPHTRPFDGDEQFRLLAHHDTVPEHFHKVLGVLVREQRQRAEQGVVAGRSQVLVVIDEYHRHAEQGDFAVLLRQGAELGFSVLCLVDEIRQVPGECGGYMLLGAHSVLALAGSPGGVLPFVPDRVPRKGISELAQRLAGLQQMEADGRRELPRSLALLRLLGIDDAKRYDPNRLWQTPPKESWHPVACGKTGAGDDDLWEIDLNEGKHGVHGIIAGTTGSGKSEFLLTLLLALAIKHSPDRVNFMLIDFKGGATFKDVAPLPHTAGIVTDLEGNMAERALVAINSELDRRKKRVLGAGVENIRSYRSKGHEQTSGYLPNLVIAIDEFDEMARDYPEFVLELVRVAKQGRSLGVHLLFATQQPSAIKEGLLRNLTYWIALRVAATDDSKAMVGIPDAAYLTTATPGRGYFRVNKQVVQFQSARVSGAYQPPTRAGMGQIDVTGLRRPINRRSSGFDKLRALLQTELNTLLPTPVGYEQVAQRVLNAYGVLETQQQLPPRAAEANEAEVCQSLAQYVRTFKPVSPTDAYHDEAFEQLTAQVVRLIQGTPPEETELSIVVERMRAVQTYLANHASVHYPIWTPPLGAEQTLHELLAIVQRSEVMGKPLAWSQFPLGQQDVPTTAQQAPYLFDLERDGNLLVLGATGAGKTTLLRSFILALAASHPPEALWVYTITINGDGCGLVLPERPDQLTTGSRRLPHLADAIAVNDYGKIERLLLELEAQIEQRRLLWAEAKADTLSQYRKERLPPPLIVVAVDKVADLLATLSEAQVEQLKTIIRAGRSFGIQWIVSAYTRREVAPIQGSFETRLALRVLDGEDSESMIGKDWAKRIPATQPGRAFVRTSDRPVEVQIALPILRNVPAETTQGERRLVFDLAAEIEATVAHIAGSHGDSSALPLPQPLPRLPDRVHTHELSAGTAPPAGGLTVAVGLENRALQPLWLDFATNEAHLLIAGGSRTGKTTLLLTMLRGLARYPVEEVRYVLVDYMGRHLEACRDLPHTLAIELDVPVSLVTNAAKEKRSVQVVQEEVELKALVEQYLVPELQRRRRGRISTPRLVLAIDDWETVYGLSSPLDQLATFALQGRVLGFHIVITSGNYPTATSGLLAKINRDRASIFMGVPADLNAGATSTTLGTIGINVKLLRQAGRVEMPTGRGFLQREGQGQLVQFALSEAVPPPSPSNMP